jgi:hypothetical protein
VQAPQSLALNAKLPERELPVLHFAHVPVAASPEVWT